MSCFLSLSLRMPLPFGFVVVLYSQQGSDAAIRLYLVLVLGLLSFVVMMLDVVMMVAFLLSRFWASLLLSFLTLVLSLLLLLSSVLFMFFSHVGRMPS